VYPVAATDAPYFVIVLKMELDAFKPIGTWNRVVIGNRDDVSSCRSKSGI
jgi:hypothetical protein